MIVQEIITRSRSLGGTAVSLLALLLLVCPPVAAQTIPPPPAPATIASLSNVVAWGDSLTVGSGAGGTAWPVQLASISGVGVAINARSGWTSTQVAAWFAADPTRRHWLNVIWLGRNNYTQTATILSDIAKMVRALPPGSRFLVLGVINANASAEWKTGADYHYFGDINRALATAYPDNFIDIRSVLVAAYNPKSPQDVTDHEHDVPPSSLISGGVHLNTPGYRIVAEQVNTWMQTHGGRTPVDFTTLNYALSFTGLLGNTVSAAGSAQAQFVTITPALPDIHDGAQICWLPAAANTGPAPTLALDGTVNTTVAFPIVKAGGAALASGDIIPSAKACVIFNAAQSRWELQNPQTATAPAPVRATLVYNEAGAVISGAKIVMLSGTLSSGSATFTLKGPAVFAAQPQCTATYAGNSSPAHPLSYCTSQGLYCPATSSASSIVIGSYMNAGTGGVNVTCIGN